MARPISLLQPSRLEIGAGAIARLDEWAAPYRRIFVVAMAPTIGFLERIGFRGEVEAYTDIPPEPDLPAVEAVLSAARAFRPDLVIGGIGDGRCQACRRALGRRADPSRRRRCRQDLCSPLGPRPGADHVGHRV
jgi:alcohol dehydrogenase class IV